MTVETLKSAFSEHPFLRGLSPAFQAILAECALEKEFHQGEIIFREGDIADRLFLIEEGRVILEAPMPPHGPLAVQELGPDEVLGWSWLFPPYVWHFQARALEATRAITFNGAHLLISCERDHELGYELMKRLAQILIRRLQATRKQLLRLHEVRNHVLHK
jgi:CRP-like cAMP-binding protein